MYDSVLRIGYFGINPSHFFSLFSFIDCALNAVLSAFSQPHKLTAGATDPVNS